MDQNRLLEEAQLIASEFRFWMVKNQLSHLYGYVYESPDGKIKIDLDIQYTERFPEEPPRIAFYQEIPGLPENLTLKSIENWTPNSHVVDILRELNAILRSIFEGGGTPASGGAPETGEQVPPPPASETVVEPATTEETGPSPTVGTGTGSEVPEKEVTVESPVEEEYITPDPTAYPDTYDTYYNPSEMPVWGEDESAAPMTDYTSEPAVEASEESTAAPPPENLLLLNTESALIQQEYAMDFINGHPGKVEIYLTVTIEQTYIIKVDFTDYPQPPKIELPSNLEKIIGDVNVTLETLRKWNPSNPPHVVEVIRELDQKLWFLSDIELEYKMIAGEFKTEMIDGVMTNLRVSLLTYGFKEYTLELDISKYPAPPVIKYSPELEELIHVPVENLKAYRNWKRKQSHVVDILHELSWLVDKNSRINFELSLLKGGIENVEYDRSSNTIRATLKGQMKTKDITFEFEVKLPEDYPASMPKIELKTDLEGMEEIKNKLMEHINAFSSRWTTFSYLIDLFNDISKAIFEVSVVSCVICHQINCPTCKKPISAPNGEDQCQTMCPYCERLYHKHCWDQTILSFGKCGFCLRKPPDDMIPK